MSRDESMDLEGEVEREDEDAFELGPRPAMTMDEMTALESLQRRLFGRGEASFRLGRYEVQRALDEIRPQRVLLGRDSVEERPVTIEVLGPPRVGDGGVAAGQRAMLNEARRLIGVHHSAVVSVFDVQAYGVGAFPGWVGAPPRGVYLVTDTVAGRTWDGWLDASRPWTQILEAGRHLAEGLAAIHAAGTVHARVCPGAIVVASGTRARLRGFGLPSALLVSDGARWLHDVGAIAPYVPPECLDGAPPSAASDQFALCVVLFESVYGERPWTGPPIKVREAMRKGPRVPSETIVPRWVGRVLLRGLAENPDDRWPDVGALARALDVQMHRRGRRRWLGAVAGAVAMVGGAWWVGSSWQGCTAARTRLAESTAQLQTQLSSASSPASIVDWQSVARRLQERLEPFPERCDRVPIGWSTLSETGSQCLLGRVRALETSVPELMRRGVDAPLRALVTMASHLDGAPCRLGGVFPEHEDVAAEFARIDLALGMGDVAAGQRHLQALIARELPALERQAPGYAALELREGRLALLTTSGAEVDILARSFERAVGHEERAVAFEAAVELGRLHARRFELDPATTWRDRARELVGSELRGTVAIEVHRLAAEIGAARGDVALERAALGQWIEAANETAWPEPLVLEAHIALAELEARTRAAQAVSVIEAARARALGLGLGEDAPAWTRLHVAELVARGLGQGEMAALEQARTLAAERLGLGSRAWAEVALALAEMGDASGQPSAPTIASLRTIAHVEGRAWTDLAVRAALRLAPHVEDGARLARRARVRAIAVLPGGHPVRIAAESSDAGRPSPEH